MFGPNEFPKQGDLLWIDAKPHAGHEYGGHSVQKNNIRRPLLVVSSDIYNKLTGMVVGFPITSKIRSDFPAAMKINSQKIHGYAVFSNLLGYDYIARNAELVDHVDQVQKIQALSAVKNIFGI
ncbi:cell growth regulatory protein [Ligilactobacillus salitolerans]|uniref:Cell growth regulatory protein n=1 Tax=Ligilactobacillus salitolerans TaxID=1808352 RepID=A0A401IR60_9LACO|nr:type II toxin-antitoxin system PemK/MazF family toxin [Ligilactobacillus salitolerans]GBG94012.1 cell growth regulatory protein [Ligilactobacillus salitolerans]